MVQQFGAQSTLQGLANPLVGDVAGAIKEGQFNTRASEILKNTVGTKIADLVQLDPERASNFANAMGIPKNATDRLKNAAGTITLVDKFIQGGAPPEEIGQFLLEQAQLLEAGGISTGIMQQAAEGFLSGDPIRIQEEAQAFGELAKQFGADFTLSQGQQRFDATGKPIATSALSSEAGQKQVNILRKNIGDVIKPFQKVESAFKKIQKAGSQDTAAGDLSLIFSFMKILDPGSTVREGEFATAQNAASIPDRVQNAYNNALKGTRLGTAQRADFITQAENLFSAEREATDNQIGNILQQADQDQISRVKLLGKSRLADFNERITTRGLGGIPAGQLAELQAARPDLTEEQIISILSE